ncbi:hypothetical protein XBKB1_980005 [Xenorhabdus bovienii str. kraussei Becker Underwood]|uniref:Uncharacterized protein n=1 Tax=Xenorhabdus bovienii str. kraussei Becker Underwood TaxID=1398204 RepID=A0A077Q1E3_XENBV|nr:hypothetical protein XBKB1_980005 [Xenorhabdus bovienii str. kraussei Becker Underwood]
MGVSELMLSSWSILRRDKLSIINTSLPKVDCLSAVAHPQNPSPPSTTIFIGAILFSGLVFIFLPNPIKNINVNN